MIVSDELVADLKRDEGFRAHAYEDTEGHLTIGFGTLIDDKFPNAGLTKAEAEYLLRNRAVRYAEELIVARSWVLGLPQGVQRALFNMAYNMGVPNLLKFRKMWTALKARDWNSAADEALDSLWARQVGDRSRRMAALIRKGGEP